jgi:hypothetical protein
MLTRRKLRALSPGHWARTRIPDRFSWTEHKGMCSPSVGDEVDVCILPTYCPRGETESSFHWQYEAAYRGVGSTWTKYQGPSGGRLQPWDFAMCECTHFNYSSKEQHVLWDGKGKYLYEPASDDPKLCPGGDYSVYLCDKCEKHVTPFSNDEGALICPFCEVTGLVIMDEATLDHLEKVREFARSMGLTSQLERQLAWLDNFGCHDDSPRTKQCVLTKDFAPVSFCFAHYVLPEFSSEGKRSLWLHGGLIYQGPGSPADGSFPSLTVSLSTGTGWFCHT